MGDQGAMWGSEGEALMQPTFWLGIYLSAHSPRPLPFTSQLPDRSRASVSGGGEKE